MTFVFVFCYVMLCELTISFRIVVEIVMRTRITTIITIGVIISKRSEMIVGGGWGE